jgi:hypothetical protein
MSVCDDMNARRNAIVAANGNASDLPSFTFIDGASEFAETDDFVHEFLRRNTIAVTYALDYKPLKKLCAALSTASYYEPDAKFALIFDEADEIVKRTQSPATAKYLAQILGRTPFPWRACECCGDRHECVHSSLVQRVGTHFDVGRLALVSATTAAISTWAERLFADDMLPEAQTMLPRTYDPRTDLPITIVGGAGGNVLELTEDRQTADSRLGLLDPEVVGRFRAMFGLRNPSSRDQALVALYFLRHCTALAPTAASWPKPTLPYGAEATGAPKIASAFAFEVTHLVNDNGRSESQRTIIDSLVDGELRVAYGIPRGAVVLNQTGTGTTVWRVGEEWPRGVNARALLDTDPELSDAEKAKLRTAGALDTLRGDLKSVGKYVDWRFGLHVPVVVVAYRCGLKAIDLVSNNRVLAGMVCRSSDSHGLETVKQQSGRTRQAYGKLMCLGFARAGIDTTRDSREVCADMDLAGVPVPLVVGSAHLKRAARTPQIARAIQDAHDAGELKIEVDQIIVDAFRCGKTVIDVNRKRKSAFEPDHDRFAPRRRVDDISAAEPHLRLRGGERPDTDERTVDVEVDGRTIAFDKNTTLAEYPGKTIVLKAAQRSWVFSKLAEDITSSSVMRNGTGHHQAFNSLFSKKNFIVRNGNSRPYKYILANPNAPFPMSF